MQRPHTLAATLMAIAAHLASAPTHAQPPVTRPDADTPEAKAATEVAPPKIREPGPRQADDGDGEPIFGARPRLQPAPAATPALWQLGVYTERDLEA